MLVIFHHPRFFVVATASGLCRYVAELKLAKLILARSGRSLAHIRASLQAVAKMAVVDYL